VKLQKASFHHGPGGSCVNDFLNNFSVLVLVTMTHTLNTTIRPQKRQTLGPWTSGGGACARRTIRVVFECRCSCCQ
jgi:hypothetical protein